MERHEWIRMGIGSQHAWGTRRSRGSRDRNRVSIRRACRRTTMRRRYSAHVEREGRACAWSMVPECFCDPRKKRPRNSSRLLLLLRLMLVRSEQEMCNLRRADQL